MDKLDDGQLEDIKMSTARLRAKLLTAGYSDEDVESLDRQTCMEKQAEQNDNTSELRRSSTIVYRTDRQALSIQHDFVARAN